MELLKPLDQFYIEKGATVPCDSYIIEGSSMVDQSAITGEYLPVQRGVGDFVLSGAKNIGPSLTAVVHKSQDESSLACLIDQASEATEAKNNGDGATEWITRYFVLGVMLLAASSFTMTIQGLHDRPLAYRMTAACQRAMTILVAACPCALGLATPSAVVAGMGKLHSGLA